MRKVKTVSALMIICLLLSSCSFQRENEKDLFLQNTVSISVSTMFAGEDGYAQIFNDAVEKWEKETGYNVSATSNTSDEAYKNRIIMDFQTGAEPDVLYYFNGVDSNVFVANKRVVSLDEIREVYPEYASNMKEDMMKASNYDGKIYCIPVNGYWEALFVNKKVLQEAGVDIPDENTSWEEFLACCRNIKNAGKTPIAVSLCEVPHYWFEYCIYNYQTPENHAIVPEFVIDNMGQAWVNGLSDIKRMYASGFFPENTLYMSDEEAKSLFLSGEAAFLLEGSWYAAQIRERSDTDNFCVTYVPGTETRQNTDIISGLSTGYFITRKAWEDDEKREAAIRFVEYMTTDEMVSRFAELSATALKKSTDYESYGSEFLDSALSMVDGATGFSEAVQDFVPTACRAPIFENMKGLMLGTTEISDAVRDVLALKKARNK